MPARQSSTESSSSREGRAQKPRRSWGRRLAWGLFRWSLVALVGLGLAGSLYLVHLQDVVRDKFEGKRWALPARVYARPLELWVGRPLTADELERELQRLAYAKVYPPSRAGSYSRNQGGFRVRTRSFQFWDGEEPERTLEIEIEGDAITQLRDAQGESGDVALARLDAPLIASIYPTHNEDRVIVQREDLPDALVQTLLAVEDRNFFDHHGVDPRAILRAGVRNLMAGGVVEGGSTLTQQLVKNFYLTQERSLQRKLNEAAMALVLDWRYDKDEILVAYVNEIYLGQDGQRAIHGFGLASQFYFNRRLQDLGLPEIATLVGLIKGPSIYNPRRNPERALQRRNLVIDVLQENGVITAVQAEQAKAQPLAVSEKGGRPVGDFPAYLELVRRQLNRDYREEDLRSEGLRIFTTLDPMLQDQAEESVLRGLERLEKRHGLPRDKLESSVVITSAVDGEVLALVGGRQSDYAGFNRALDARRPIGSLVKPAVYLAALSDPGRFSLVTPLRDEPVSLRIPGSKRWEPKNYDGKIHGRVPLYQALARSYNLATVNLGLDVGLDRVAKTLEDLGAGTEVEAVPSLFLGAASLAPIDVAQVYQTIASGGFRTPLRAIRDVLDASARPLTRYPLTVQPASSTGATYLLQWAMQQVVEQGTAKALKHVLPKDLVVAGKTGTTDELRDSWFAGFSADKVAVVWVGRDDNQPARLSGATGAMQIWGDIMAHGHSQPLLLLPTEGIEEVRVAPGSGLRADGGCPGARVVPFIQGSAPTRSGSCGAEQVAEAPRQPPPPPVYKAPEPQQAPPEEQAQAPAEQRNPVKNFFRSIFKW